MVRVPPLGSGSSAGASRSVPRVALLSFAFAALAAGCAGLAHTCQRDGGLAILAVPLFGTGAAVLGFIGLLCAAISATKRPRGLALLGAIVNLLVIFMMAIALAWPSEATLVSAAGRGDDRAVRRALWLGVSPNAHSYWGWNRENCGNSALAIAAFGGRVKVVELLLDAGAQDRSVLTEAVRGDRQDVVEYLLRRKVPADFGGAMQMAVECNRLEIAKILVAQDPSVSVSTAVAFASAEHGDLPMVSWLLSIGNKLDEKNNEGMTMLHLAARRGQVELIRELLEHGAPVDTVDAHGQTPLQLTIAAGKPEAADVLVAHGADPLRTSEGDRTLLHMVGTSVSAAEWCVRHQVPLDAVDWRQRTALHFAAESDSIAVIEYLVAAGASVDARDRDGWTPLLVAVERSRTDAVLSLVRLGANVAATLGDGRTGLHLSARNHGLAIARHLLKHGAPAAVTANDGKTALDIAKEANFEPMVVLLRGYSTNADIR